MMNIAVVGTGYVGLVTGTCLAEMGNHVTCMDIDQEKVARLKSGDIPIYEPGLEIIFERNTRQERLHFTTDLAKAVDGASIIFLALPTPPNEQGAADLSYVLDIARQLSVLIKDYKIIVNKSTVPVGTAEKVHAVLGKNLSTELFDVVSNPEFLREGVAVDDFMKPDRVIIGIHSDNERVKKLMRRLYGPFVRQGNPVLFMDARSAEMAKYAANAYLAARISFMNEIANLCERTGADVDCVRRGIGSDSRIGKRFLFPGIGFGGSCFPKDVHALARTADEYAYDFKILDAVLNVNHRQRLVLVDKIYNYFGKDIAKRTFAIWGLSFKPNTDDIREAPALYIIDELLAAGANIKAYDPEAMPNVNARYQDKIELTNNMYDALQDADALLVLTEWSVFRAPDFDQIKNALNQPVIFDGRNVYTLSQMKNLGFYYESIGRQVVSKNIQQVIS